MKSLLTFALKLGYPIFKKIFPYQVYAYLSVGALNTFLNIGLFTVFFLLFNSTQSLIGSYTIQHIAVELATIFSFIITVFTGFWLSKHFAFTDASTEKTENQKQFSKYFLVSLQGQFSDYLITKALIVFIHIEPTIAYLISTIIMLIINFFLQKYYTFKTKK